MQCPRCRHENPTGMKFAGGGGRWLIVWICGEMR